MTTAAPVSPPDPLPTALFDGPSPAHAKFRDAGLCVAPDGRRRLLPFAAVAFNAFGVENPLRGLASLPVRLHAA